MNRKQLEQKFRTYQSLLADRVEQEQRKHYIDIAEITDDYCVIDQNGIITIKHVPVEGEQVYFSVVGKDNEVTDILVSYEEVGDYQFRYLVELMRKAMIIEELRSSIVRV